MQIQTFMNPATDKYTMVRAEYTLRFMAKHLKGKAETCLDIGEPNMVGDYLCKELELKKTNTDFDLDIENKFYGKYDVVICLEVMEHLMSPKYFLVNLSKALHKDSQIFFTYPSRPYWLWTAQHFHEYSKKRFIYLLNHCGYEVIDWKRKYFPSSFIGRFRGLRPFIRQFVNYDNLVYAKLINKGR